MIRVLALLLALICALAAIAETATLAPRIVEKRINYDNVEYIRPDMHATLIEDLERRTGLNILKVEVGKIDYLSDSAQLVVFCSEYVHKKGKSAVKVTTSA